MAPHWKCGSGQPVAGSNPALSATTHAARTPMRALAGSGPRSRTLAVRSLRSSPAAFASTPMRRADAPLTRDSSPVRSAVDFQSRARRGTSGALYLQSAPAGLNSHPRSPYSKAAASSDVEDRVPRSGDSRTVSGPEGSSTKRSSSGAAEWPGPSRSSRWARDHVGRRWVHGNDLLVARDRTGAL
jgi:hypothetical protein